MRRWGCRRGTQRWNDFTSQRTSFTAEALNQTASPHPQNVPKEHETASSSGSPLSCRWGGWHYWDQFGDLRLMKGQEGRIDEWKEILAFRSCFILPSIRASVKGLFSPQTKYSTWDKRYKLDLFRARDGVLQGLSIGVIQRPKASPRLWYWGGSLEELGDQVLKVEWKYQSI